MLPLGFFAVLARPLRRHEAKQCHRDDALPADSSAGLDRGAENFWIEQPGRRMRARRTRENGALAGTAAGRRADDCCDQR